MHPPEPVATQAPPQPSRLAIAAALAVFAVMGVTTASLGAALPAFRDRYHVSATTGSHLVSLYMLGSLIAIIAGGAGESRLRPVSTITTLTGLFAGGCLGMGLAPNWTVLQLTAVVAGAGFGGLALYINTAFAQAFRGRSLVMLNVLNAAYAAGTVAGPLVAGLLTHIGVRLLFLASGLLAVGCLPARDFGRVLTRADPANRANPANPASSASSASSANPSSSRGRAMMKILLPFAAISFLYEGIETSTGAWESTHLTWLGFSASAAAQIAALFWAGLFAGRLIIPVFTSRLPLPAVIVGGLFTGTIALAGAALPGLTPYAYALAGFGLAPVFPAIVGWIDQVAPVPQFANAVMLSAGMTGGVLWPGLIGLIAAPRLPAAIPLGLAGIGLLSLAAAWNASRSRNQAGSPPTPKTSTSATAA